MVVVSLCYLYCYYLCVAQVRKSSLSQVLNAEAYMLFYKRGVALAKLMHDDGSSVHPVTANGKCHDFSSSVCISVLLWGHGLGL